MTVTDIQRVLYHVKNGNIDKLTYVQGSLTYGPVYITDGIHAGKVGLYDDDEHTSTRHIRTAIVYLDDSYVFIDPNYLVNIVEDDDV